MLISIIIGGISGWIACLMMKTDAQMGIIANVLIGIVGSALGHFVAGAMGIAVGNPLSYVIAVLGAMLLIGILRAAGVFA